MSKELGRLLKEFQANWGTYTPTPLFNVTSKASTSLKVTQSKIKRSKVSTKGKKGLK